MKGKLSARDKFTRIRYELFTDRPFYGKLIMYLDLKEFNNIATIAVSEDGTLLYNKKFISNVGSEQQLESLLCHEIMHLAIDTFGRQEWRDKLVASESHLKCQDCGTVFY